MTCCLLVGSFAERIKFSAVLAFMVLWFTFSYLPIAHMVWFSQTRCPHGHAIRCIMAPASYPSPGTAMLLVCPACASTNRVPDERLHDGAVCGKCGTALMEAKPIDVSDAVLPKFLAGTELPVVVDFWASWCGPCHQMAPHFAAAAKQLPDARFVKVDSDAAKAASARFGIRSIPTLIVFQRGVEVARRSGASSTADIVSWLRPHLARSAA